LDEISCKICLLKSRFVRYQWIPMLDPRSLSRVPLGHLDLLFLDLSTQKRKKNQSQAWSTFIRSIIRTKNKYSSSILFHQKNKEKQLFMHVAKNMTNKTCEIEIAHDCDYEIIVIHEWWLMMQTVMMLESGEYTREVT